MNSSLSNLINLITKEVNQQNMNTNHLDIKHSKKSDESHIFDIKSLMNIAIKTTENVMNKYKYSILFTSKTKSLHHHTVYYAYNWEFNKIDQFTMINNQWDSDSEKVSFFK
jgi:hypothetical protein